MSFAVLLAVAVAPTHGAWAALDPEDQKLIDEASCEEIQREYRNYWVAEREVEAEIRVAIAEGARKKGCRL